MQAKVLRIALPDFPPPHTRGTLSPPTVVGWHTMTFNDHRLEAFARNLALGMPTKAAARAAHFTASTAHSKAHVMAKRPALQARVAELRATLPQMGFSTETQRPAQPEEPSVEVTFGDAEPAFVPAEKPRTGRSPPAPLAPGGPVTREWLTSFLQVVAADAIVARDRRTAIAAADLLAKVNGLHAPQQGPAASLAQLDASALQRLLALLDEALGGDDGSASEPSQAMDLGSLNNAKAGNFSEDAGEQW
jgi:hypothetical protein